MTKKTLIEKGDIVVDKSPYGMDENDVVLKVISINGEESRCEDVLYPRIRHTCMTKDLKPIGITTEKLDEDYVKKEEWIKDKWDEWKKLPSQVKTEGYEEGIFFSITILVKAGYFDKAKFVYDHSGVCYSLLEEYLKKRVHKNQIKKFIQETHIK